MVPSTGRPTEAYPAWAASAMPSARAVADRSSGPASPSRLHSAPTSEDRITPELPRAPSRAPRANAESAVRTSAGAGAVAASPPTASCRAARAASTVR
jgi:hypothetical protein